MTVRLDDIIEKVDRLPALPASTCRLMEVVSDPRASIHEVIEVVQFDQSLTGQVLRLCNSAYFGLSRKIASLHDAVAYMGSHQLMQLVLGVHCNTLLEAPQPGYGLLEGMLWRHASAVALASERMGRLGKGTGTEVLFTAGLLHDIGKVILGMSLADRYKDVVALLSERPITFHEAERDVLGFSHAEVGELVTSHWRLPEPIVAAARYHHEPHLCPDDDPKVQRVVELVHAADSLAMTMGAGVGNDGLLYSIDLNVVKKHRLGEETLDRISVDVLTELQRLEGIYKTTRSEP